MGSFDKVDKFKPWFIFCSVDYVWELAHKLSLPGRKESDNKGRIIDWNNLVDSLSLLELARKAKLNIIRRQMSGSLFTPPWVRLLSDWAWKGLHTLHD